MRALMANEVQTDSGGPLNFLRRHCKTIQIVAAIALSFVLGMAVDNHHTTQAALNGQANYFVYKYAPKVAAKAAGAAIKNAVQNCPDNY